MTEQLGDPQEIGEALEQMDSKSMAPDPSRGIFGGLGPLSNTEPSTPIENVEEPKLNASYAKRYAWRGILKIQGSEAMAITDFIMAAVTGSIALFFPENAGEREEVQDTGEGREVQLGSTE